MTAATLFFDQLVDVIAALPAAPRALNGQHVEPALDAAEYEEGSGPWGALGFGKLTFQHNALGAAR